MGMSTDGKLVFGVPYWGDLDWHTLLEMCQQHAIDNGHVPEDKEWMADEFNPVFQIERHCCDSEVLVIISPSIPDRIREGRYESMSHVASRGSVTPIDPEKSLVVTQEHIRQLEQAIEYLNLDWENCDGAMWYLCAWADM